MTKKSRVLAVIPARGGSKGLPGKNIRSLAGLPLIAHSIKLAQMCPEIDRILVNTDDEKIAEIARNFGVEIPFLRPKELAQDDTPMWPVLKQTLDQLKKMGEEYEYLMLLDPTSPGRIPSDVTTALSRLQLQEESDGIIGVSRPEFNPIWHCVVEKEGWMAPLISGGGKYGRRQDVPMVYRINATLYIWRTRFIKQCENNWLENGKYLMHEIPEKMAIHIDDLDEFQKAELFIQNRLISLPWLI